MTKKIFAMLSVCIALFASCIREEDKDLLRHPIHVRGEVDPHFGAPIAYGKVSLNDLLGMLSSTYTGYVDENEEILTIYFDTTLSDTIRNVGGEKGFRHYGAKDEQSGGISKDTIITYGVDLTFFDDAVWDTLVNDNIELGSLIFGYKAFMQARCPENVNSILRDSTYVEASVCDFKILYTDHDGHERVYENLDIPFTTIDTLIEGQTIVNDSMPMQDIVNALPRRLALQFKFNFTIKPRFFVDYMNDVDFNQLLDSLKKTDFFYRADAKIRMPLSFRIGHLGYNYTLDLTGDSLSKLDIQNVLDSIDEGLEVHLEEARLILAFENGIPLELTVGAALLDENDAQIGDSLIRRDPLPGRTSDGQPGEKRLTVRIDEEFLREIGETKKIGFNLGLRTTGGQMVDIRRSDNLGIKAYVTLHPKATFDVRLTDEPILAR